MLASSNDVIDQTHKGHANKHDGGPVEKFQCCGCRIWPEAPEKGVCGIQNTTDVDRDAPLSEGPAAVGEEFWVANTAVENGADGKHVGYHQGYNVEGDD